MSVKERILDAGVAMLHEQGITSLTQPRIAKAAGVSQSHLTYYFSTRNLLLLAIAERSVEKIVESIESIGGGDEVFPFEEIAHNPRIINQARMMLGLAIAGDADPELRKALIEFVTNIREKTREIIAKFGIHITPETLILFHSTLVGLVVLNFVQQSQDSEKDLMMGMQKLILLLRNEN